MTIARAVVYEVNLLVEALQLALTQRSISPNEVYNDSYYTTSTYNNLAKAIPWITESLQTMNTNIASGIDQSTDHVAGLIGTPQSSRRLGDSSIHPGGETLFQRLEHIDDKLNTMSDDMKEIGEAIGSGPQKPNRGKASKKSKKKKNMFDQAEVEDEEHEGPGRDRLLLTSLGKQIEAKIDSQNEKIGRLEDKLDKVAASQNEKIDILSSRWTESRP